jgi:hypothetical protein
MPMDKSLKTRSSKKRRLTKFLPKKMAVILPFTKTTSKISKRAMSINIAKSTQRH